MCLCVCVCVCAHARLYSETVSDTQETPRKNLLLGAVLQYWTEP